MPHHKLALLYFHVEIPGENGRFKTVVYCKLTIYTYFIGFLATKYK